jgi:2-keto-4-pentenoate hydratase/2-oxohepta-3-ene-1,7-dioic acid hydratase in catechol pathway
VKLCRFELKSEPGIVRSGMVFSGKIYETDGAEAVAVYEAGEVRPLAPITKAPAVRLFRSDLQPGFLPGMDESDPYYFCVNPSGFGSASSLLPYPDGVGVVEVDAYLAAVVVSDAFQIDLAIADDIILGYTLMAVLVGRSLETAERKAGGIGKSNDLGGVIGPVLTTPDELEERVSSDDRGRKFDLQTTVRLNSVERGRGNTDLLPFSAAQAIASVSMHAPVRSGDVFAFGPLATLDADLTVDPGDEFQIAVDSLGTLTLKLEEHQ